MAGGVVPQYTVHTLVNFFEEMSQILVFAFPIGVRTKHDTFHQPYRELWRPGYQGRDLVFESASEQEGCLALPFPG
jgi:hypothetical protein